MDIVIIPGVHVKNMYPKVKAIQPVQVVLFTDAQQLNMDINIKNNKYETNNFTCSLASNINDGNG